MAGSLSGIGGQPQPPISNTFQPGGQSGQVQAREAREAAEETEQAAETGRTQEARRPDKTPEDRPVERPGSAESTAQRRGAVVDITV